MNVAVFNEINLIIDAAKTNLDVSRRHLNIARDMMLEALKDQPLTQDETDAWYGLDRAIEVIHDVKMNLIAIQVQK